MKDKLKKLQVGFVGELDWSKLRDLLIVKLNECQSEEDLSRCIKMLLGSMFSDAKEIDETRKALRLELLTEREKQKINKFKTK